MLKRSQITWGVFAGGWLLVLAVVAARPVFEHWYVAPFAVMTLFLVWQRDFPWRREGLLTSWIGPLLMGLGATSEEPLWRILAAKGGASGAALLMAVHAIEFAILMIWLFRYYGILPLFAMMATVWPHRLKNVGRLNDEYPWRWWWTIPIFIAAWQGAVAILIYLWGRPLPR
jgi:hypothetical protein